MLDPTIDPWFSRAATTEADAKAAGFDSVDAANAALDAALVKAGFSPIQAEHFTVQVNSSIGVLPNDRYPEDGVTCKLTLPQATKGQMAQEYYLVQMCTADGRFRKAGDIIVTPVRMDTYEKNGLEFTAYSQSIVAPGLEAPVLRPCATNTPDMTARSGSQKREPLPFFVCGRNSFRQSLTALPAPSMREPCPLRHADGGTDP